MLDNNSMPVMLHSYVWSFSQARHALPNSTRSCMGLWLAGQMVWEVGRMVRCVDEAKPQMPSSPGSVTSGCASVGSYGLTSYPVHTSRNNTTEAPAHRETSVSRLFPDSAQGFGARNWLGGTRSQTVAGKLLLNAEHEKALDDTAIQAQPSPAPHPRVPQTHWWQSNPVNERKKGSINSFLTPVFARAKQMSGCIVQKNLLLRKRATCKLGQVWLRLRLLLLDRQQSTW